MYTVRAGRIPVHPLQCRRAGCIILFHCVAKDVDGYGQASTPVTFSIISNVACQKLFIDRELLKDGKLAM